MQPQAEAVPSGTAPKEGVQTFGRRPGRCRWVRSVVSLFLLTSHDKGLRATQSEVSLKLFSMLRFGTLLVIAATALSGCSIDVESLKDCKDKDGQPLPQWICNDTRKEKSD